MILLNLIRGRGKSILLFRKYGMSAWVTSSEVFHSFDGLDWKLAKYPLVSDLNIKWADGSTQKLEALERPQLYFENGKPVALL